MDLVTKINTLSAILFGDIEPARGTYLAFGPSRTIDGKIIRPVAEVMDAHLSSSTRDRTDRGAGATGDVHQLGSIIIEGDSADFIPSRQRRDLVPVAIGISVALLVGFILLLRKRS